MTTQAVTKKALIIGCGYVGSALANKLSAMGFEISGIRRSWPEKVAHIDCIECDVGQPFQLEHNYDLVVYCVAAGERSEEAYQRAYSVGVQNTIDAVKLSSKKPEDLPYFVFTSSTSVYKEKSGNEVDESSTLEDVSLYSKALVSGEELVQKSFINHLVLRLSGIYGPQRNHLLKKLYTNYPYFSKNPYSNRIHLEDIVGSLLYLYHNKSTGVFNISDREPSRVHDIFNWLEEQMKIEIKFDKELETTATGKRIKSDKLQSTGYNFVFPTYREGFQNWLSHSPKS